MVFHSARQLTNKGYDMLTEHVLTRINNRLAGLLDTQDIDHMRKVASKINARKHYIRIKQLPSTLYLPDTSGDCLTVIIEGNNVITAMLSHSQQRWHDGTFKVLLTK